MSTRDISWGYSRCRRTESIVSLERGVCSCAELQVFSCFFLQDQAPNEIHAILRETLGEHALSYATVKNWVAQFERGEIFPSVMRLVLDDTKQ